jgi:hypothetical protein
MITITALILSAKYKISVDGVVMFMATDIVIAALICKALIKIAELFA